VAVSFTKATRKPAPHLVTAAAGHTKPTVLARLTKTFTSAGSYHLHVKLTRKGKGFLRQLLAELQAGTVPGGFLVMTFQFLAH
jgi:glycine cleavage system regulatory protein